MTKKAVALVGLGGITTFYVISLSNKKENVHVNISDVSKLPIYEKEEKSFVIVEEYEPSPIREYVDEIRNTYETAQKNVTKWKTATLETLEKTRKFKEGMADGTIRILPGKENILPSSLYVATSSLFSLLVFRRSNFLVRFMSPILTGLVSFGYFYPNSTEVLISRAEAKYNFKRPTVSQIEASAYDLVMDRYQVLKSIILGDNK